MIKACVCECEMEEAAKQALGMLDNPQQTPRGCTLCFFSQPVCVLRGKIQ